MVVSRPASISTEEVVRMLGSDALAVLGDPTATFSRVAPLADAGPDSATFCSASGPDAIGQICRTGAGVVVCSDLPELRAQAWRKTLILTVAPRFAFLRVVRAFFSPPRPRGIDPSAI